MNEADLRISDAERADAAAELGEHYAHGRLDLDEHAERLDRIWAAKTRRDLAPVFADLPGRVPLPPYAAVHWPRRRRSMPFGLVAVLGVLAVITVLTHLPLVLMGLGVWFLLSRNRCSAFGRRPRPSVGCPSPPVR